MKREGSDVPDALGRSGAGDDRGAARRARPRGLPGPRHRLARRCRRTIPMPWSATRRTWSSPASPHSSTRRRRAPPPRSRRWQRSGVAVKIVTGDNELVTRHVCAQLGMPVTGVLTGKEIAQLDDQALAVRVEAATLFCRVTPAQKNRVILALEAPRPRRRLSGRRHQRRALVALGRCRHLGGQRPSTSPRRPPT